MRAFLCRRIQHVCSLDSPFRVSLCVKDVSLCCTITSSPVLSNVTQRETEEFAAAPHLFSGCCLSVCFLVSSCVFKRQFLPARDTWKEPWHEQKTSPQRRRRGGGWNDNTRKETRPRNKLRLNRKTIKLQRWEEEEGKNPQTHAAMKANNTGKQGRQCVCEKILARANYTECQIWMPGIRGKQKSFVGNGNHLNETTRYHCTRQKHTKYQTTQSLHLHIRGENEDNIHTNAQ